MVDDDGVYFASHRFRFALDEHFPLCRADRPNVRFVAFAVDHALDLRTLLLGLPFTWRNEAVYMAPGNGWSLFRCGLQGIYVRRFDDQVALTGLTGKTRKII